MNPTQAGRPACHNCRRRRLKCDRSLPCCRKCVEKGQTCLGYQRLLRWEAGVASRGKMAGMTFEQMTRHHTKHQTSRSQSLSPTSPSRRQCRRESTEASWLASLTDPLVQDVPHASRKYLSYFASDVCKDFVLYDIPEQNPFRELIPLTHKHPILLQPIIAISALHMSNTCQKLLLVNTSASVLHHCKSLPDPACSRPSALQPPRCYYDALVAKQQAIHLLRSALTSLVTTEIDVILAVVLLFIEYELIDTGRDIWRYHINGARTIIERLCGSEFWTQADMSPLRRCLISNCLVFDTVGSALICSTGLVPSATFSTGAQSLLQDEEGNHCSSFPTKLLELLRTGAQLSLPNHPSYSSSSAKQEEALYLLSTAISFDPLTWATKLQPHSPTTDLKYRRHVASAHRAAVCIYLSRVLKSFAPTTQLPHNLEAFVADVIRNLSVIRPSNPLFKATTWPAFIAGAETHDPESQKWVAVRFQELWDVEPWGLLRGASEVVDRIWASRWKQVLYEEGNFSEEPKEESNWISDLRGSGVDWLIL